MKVGDLVSGREEEVYYGYVGLVLGFDEDDDPIVLWCNEMKGSNEFTPGCGEYRNTLEVLSESR